jgi:hypothetical protein
MVSIPSFALRIKIVKIDNLKSNIHEIILVGGSTRIPRIVKPVSDFVTLRQQGAQQWLPLADILPVIKR